MALAKRRLRPVEIDEQRAIVAALPTLKGYKPNNPQHSLEAVNTLANAMEETRRAEVLAKNALAAARDAAAAAEWALQEAILGVRAQVVAQYGPNSDEVAALGLKKKSDRRRPTRRTTT
jgi:hypothetical protein